MMMIMKSLFIHSFLPTALPLFIHSSDDAIIIIIIIIIITYVTIQYNNDAYMLMYTETGAMKSNDHHLLLLQLIGNQKY